MKTCEQIPAIQPRGRLRLIIGHCLCERRYIARELRAVDSHLLLTSDDDRAVQITPQEVQGLPQVVARQVRLGVRPEQCEQNVPLHISPLGGGQIG